jgi:hypothetical protein
VAHDSIVAYRDMPGIDGKIVQAAAGVATLTSESARKTNERKATLNMDSAPCMM